MKIRIKKLHLTYILFAVTFGFFFISLQNQPALNVSAAGTLGYGESCKAQKNNCASKVGFSLISESNIQFRGMTSGDFITSINSSYSNGANTLCINSGFAQIFRYYMVKDDSVTPNSSVPAGDQLKGYNWQDNLFVNDTASVPRACPPGWSADEGSQGFPGYSNPIGCCPSGFEFINVKGEEKVTDVQQGVCVKKSLGASYVNLAGSTIPYVQKGIYDSTGQIIIPLPDAGANWAQASSWAELQTKMQTDGFIYSYRNEYGTVVQPELGQGLGPNFLGKSFSSDTVGQRIVTGDAFIGAPNVCGDGFAANDCAVVDVGPADQAVVGGFVVPATTLNDAAGASLMCSKCYKNGISIETTASSGTTPGQLVSCKNGKIAKTDLVGGSDSITQGYLLTDDPVNYKACYDSGGIYTAIGCIDPTPTGIITGLIRIALGVMGGVALLQMVYVGILYQMGDTEKIKSARSQLIATLTGVAVLVFSVLILRIIGVNILDILPANSV